MNRVELASTEVETEAVPALVLLSFEALYTGMGDIDAQIACVQAAGKLTAEVGVSPDILSEVVSKLAVLGDRQEGVVLEGAVFFQASGMVK